MSRIVPPYRDVTAKETGLFEICARHTARQTCRTVQSNYFCDDCAMRLVKEAFNDRAPIYNGETLQGFCGLCNESREVSMRQWFVCGPCWSVVLAYQKSMAATVGLRAWWESKITNNFATFALEETEPVLLRAFERSKKSKFESAVSQEVLDFMVSDSSARLPTRLFHIEQKAGPGSIDEMTEFQLDVNDFNDIAGAMNKTNLPSYVIHVQVEHEYLPPTRKTNVVAMWWTDIYRLQDKKKRISNRRDEKKRAVYFKPTAFNPIETFEDELRSGGYKSLAERLAQSPVELIV